MWQGGTLCNDLHPRLGIFNQSEVLFWQIDANCNLDCLTLVHLSPWLRIPNFWSSNKKCAAWFGMREANLAKRLGENCWRAAGPPNHVASFHILTIALSAPWCRQLLEGAFDSPGPAKSWPLKLGKSSVNDRDWDFQPLRFTLICSKNLCHFFQISHVCFDGLRGLPRISAQHCPAGRSINATSAEALELGKRLSNRFFEAVPFVYCNACQKKLALNISWKMCVKTMYIVVVTCTLLMWFHLFRLFVCFLFSPTFVEWQLMFLVDVGPCCFDHCNFFVVSFIAISRTAGPRQEFYSHDFLPHDFVARTWKSDGGLSVFISMGAELI